MVTKVIRYIAVVCSVLVLAVMPALLASCSDDGGTTTVKDEKGTVLFAFSEVVDGSSLVLGTSGGYPYTNAAGNAYNVVELLYYTSNFALHRADGSSYGTDHVHFRDAGDPATQSFRLENVPAGTYTSVSFTFGIDARRNKDGALLPDFDQIPWPAMLGGGYHYMMMNGNWDQPIVGDTPIRVHTGRRFIMANPGPANADPPGPDATPHHHYFEVYLTLSSPLVVADKETWSIPVELNINGYFVNPLFDFGDWFLDSSDASMIMPKLAPQDLLLQNGIAGSVCSASTPVKM